MSKRDREDPTEWMEELKARQRNIWMGDQIRNSGVFYRAAWHGSEDAPIVQRIGLALIGIVVLGTGIVFFFTLAPRSVIEITISAAIMGGFVYVGIRLMWNAFFP